MCNDSNDVKQKLDEAVNHALFMLYQRDRYLIINHPNLGEHDNHVSERGIVYKFAHYLENYFSKKGWFEEYYIDVEYNRNMIAPKRLPSYPNGTYPDAIIHKRGENGSGNNLLVMEFKTWWNKSLNDIKNDMRKVNEFMDANGIYVYTHGLFILIEREMPKMKWISGKRFRA